MDRKIISEMEVAGVNVAIVEKIYPNCGNPYTEYGLQFTGTQTHVDFLRDEIRDEISLAGFDTHCRYHDNQLTFRQEDSNRGSLGNHTKAVNPAALSEAIRKVQGIYPEASLIDLKLQSKKGRSTLDSERNEMAQKSGAAKILLGDSELLQQRLERSFKNAGSEISLGGQVYFNLDSDVGQQFLKSLADELLLKVTESIPLAAAEAIISPRKLYPPRN